MKLNVGSGQRKFGEGWTNCDIQPRWNPDVVADCNHMPMFADSSAEMIVLHHVIEHFGLGELDNAIRECHRILQPGGSLIVTTPDLNLLCRRWIAHMIDDYTFCVNLYGAYMGDEADRHKWLYTGRTLAKALGGAVAWKVIKTFDFRPIEGADIACDWHIHGAEAIK